MNTILYLHNFYRPQRSWGKVMFLQVCVILFTGGVPDQVLPPRTRYTPPGPGTPPGPDTPPRDQVHPPGARYTPPGTREIRSTRGRYASYWNAFLLSKMNLIIKLMLAQMVNFFEFYRLGCNWKLLKTLLDVAAYQQSRCYEGVAAGLEW